MLYVVAGIVILGSLVAVSILGDWLVKKILQFVKEEEA